MEDDALVVAAACVTNKVLHRFRCLLREQTEMNVTKRCVYRGRVRDRRRACSLRRGRGNYQLFFTRRPLVEDVTVTRLIIPEGKSVKL